MIKFHDIKNKNLFDLCPPSINEKNWDKAPKPGKHPSGEDHLWNKD